MKGEVLRKYYHTLNHAIVVDCDTCMNITITINIKLIDVNPHRASPWFT